MLAAAGLPILGRYLLLPAALLAVFAGAGVFGWRRCPHDHAWRTRWAIVGAAVLVAFVIFTPEPGRPDQRLRTAMHTQTDILADLHAISDEIPCQPVAVPNHRPVPHVALWTGIAPGRDRVRPARAADAAAAYIDPASERVERNFTLDPRDPKRLTATVPPGFEEQRATRAGCSRPAVDGDRVSELPVHLQRSEKWTVHPLSKSASRDCPPH